MNKVYQIFIVNYEKKKLNHRIHKIDGTYENYETWYKIVHDSESLQLKREKNNFTGEFHLKQMS